VRPANPADRVGHQGDDGHVAIEASIAVIGLLLVLWLFVGGLRLTNAEGDVKAAARAAARAAAVVDADDGHRAAEAVAAETLAGRGVNCQALRVEVERRPGDAAADLAALVRVAVHCTVALGDVALAGFSGTRPIDATAVALVDVFRGGA
jgi:Flp pilus assembly protein TadG